MIRTGIKLPGVRNRNSGNSWKGNEPGKKEKTILKNFSPESGPPGFDKAIDMRFIDWF